MTNCPCIILYSRGLSFFIVLYPFIVLYRPLSLIIVLYRDDYRGGYIRLQTVIAILNFK